MKNLFFTGGPLFMGILTIVLIVMVVWVVVHTLQFKQSNAKDASLTIRKIGYTRSIGLFAMIFGIFGQMLGLYQALSVIEQAGDISPALVFGGIKVSMIAPLYGVLIFLISLILWFVATSIIDKSK